MSAYSEWKAGLITDDQYKSSYAQEQWEQDHLYETVCDRCSYVDECEYDFDYESCDDDGENTSS